MKSEFIYRQQILEIFENIWRELGSYKYYEILDWLNKIAD